mgnify:CR=1 FL=1
MAGSGFPNPKPPQVDVELVGAEVVDAPNPKLDVVEEVAAAGAPKLKPVDVVVAAGFAPKLKEFVV